jgi:hypothetical protein
MFVLLALLACGSTPPVEAPPEVVAEAPAPAEEPPVGKIGGEPILPKPTVIGAIDDQAVEDGIAARRAAIVKCWEDARAERPHLRGKVLVKFHINRDGTVSETSTKSTSLRHPGAEACVNERVAEAKFPALTSGSYAIVQYPFVFPPS